MLPDVAASATDQAAANQGKNDLVETAEREVWIFGQILLIFRLHPNCFDSFWFMQLWFKDSKASFNGGKACSRPKAAAIHEHRTSHSALLKQVKSYRYMKLLEIS